MQIGAQLYTVRNSTQTLEDFSETLKKVADIGYKTVQVSGTCPFPAEWLKSELQKNGLKCVVTHTPPARLTNETEAVCAEHKVFGCKYVGFGWNAFKLDDGDTPEKFIENYLPVAKTIRNSGLRFMYHNHDQEFQKVGGRLIIDILAEAFADADAGFIVDTFWVQAAGADPAAWIRKLSGRAPCIHLKDYAYGRRFAVVGEGNMNFDAVFGAAADSGVEYMLVEQDDCYGEDPFECLKRSYQYLKSRGFE